MSKIIDAFHLKPDEPNMIMVPVSAELMNPYFNYGLVILPYVRNADNLEPKVARYFEVYAGGDYIDHKGVYLGSCSMGAAEAGVVQLHCFEVIKG